jgi:hypothetical protein
MTMTINAAMTLLVAELEAGEVPQPLSQRFTLAAVWQDLARLAGEALPADALAVVGRALDVTIEPVGVRRGLYAEHALEFAD